MMHFLRKLAAIALILGSTALLQAQETPAPISEAIPAFSPERVAEINQLLVSIPQQTQKLRLILTALIQKSEPSFIKGIEHAAVRLWALQLQQILKTIGDKPTISPEMLSTQAQTNLHCAQLLKTALNSKLTVLPGYNPTKAFPQTELSFSDIFTWEHETFLLLHDIEPAVKNLGLHMGNKLARQTELLWRNYIGNNPWIKYAGITAALCFAGRAGYQWLQGETSYDMVTPEGIMPTMVTNSSRASNYIKEILTGAASHAPLAIGSSLLYTGKDLISHEWSFIKTKLTNGWNHLKGVESILDAAGYQAIGDTTITFASEELIGLEEQMEEIKPILDCCKDLDDFVRRGNAPQFGTLLIGPSGCGKTHFSHALAGTIHQICKVHGKDTKVTFREISCLDLVRFSLREHIADARRQGGVVVLFIDEIHNLSMQTTKNSYALNDFLTQMADLYLTDVPNSYVFLIAATNQPELLGTSLLVPGRFGKIIRFSYPTAEKRTALFHALLPRAGVNPEEIDIESLVRQTGEHVSFGKLQAIIHEARIKAEGSAEPVGQKHLQHAIDTLVHRFKATLDLSNAEKQALAVYQASKAMVYGLVASNVHVERVTIGGINQEVQELNEYGHNEKLDPNKNSLYIPRYGAVILYRTHQTTNLDDLLEQQKQCKALVAGTCGQDLLLNTHSALYAAPDMQQALQIAQEMVLDGKQFEDLSEQRQNDVKDAAEALLATYRQEVSELLALHKPALEALVTKLASEITLSGQDVEAALQ